MSKTALIILNYNNSRDTRNCIESILSHNSAPVKFIVLDNDSRAAELSALKSQLSKIFDGAYHYYESESDAPETLPDVSLVSTGKNLGYARGNNVGLRLAYNDPEIDYVMILNNDILFVSDIIPPMLAKHKSLPDCAIISPVLYKKGLVEYDYDCARKNLPTKALIHRNFMHYWWKARKKTIYDVYPGLFILKEAGCPDRGCVEIALPSGSCMLVNKDYFREIGSFDEGTFLFFEENILYKKIEATGKKNYLSLDEKCIHLGASTMKEMPRSRFVVKAGKDSESYYVREYSGAGALTKAIHWLSVKFYMATFDLQKTLMRK